MSTRTKYAVSSFRLASEVMSTERADLLNLGLETHTRDMSPRERQQARKIARAFASVK